LPNPDYAALSAILPAMASDELQATWTGSSGQPLLDQTTAFVRTLERLYAQHAGEPLDGKTILDFGVGYGRIIRLMFRYTDPGKLWGLDAWERSLDTCREVDLPVHLRLSDSFPEDLPVDGTAFDLAYAFSVFTHLSPRAATAALGAIRTSMKPGGLLVLTIRPMAIWDYYAQIKGWTDAPLFRAMHEATGFGFKGHGGPEGESYGDASVDPAFFDRPGWQVVGRDWNSIDAFQMILVLKAVPFPGGATAPAVRRPFIRRALSKARRVLRGTLRSQR
jgi:SAM-dependent methyltransferase